MGEGGGVVVGSCSSFFAFSWPRPRGWGGSAERLWRLRSGSLLEGHVQFRPLVTRQGQLEFLAELEQQFEAVLQVTGFEGLDQLGSVEVLVSLAGAFHDFPKSSSPRRSMRSSCRASESSDAAWGADLDFHVSNADYEAGERHSRSWGRSWIVCTQGVRGEGLEVREKERAISATPRAVRESRSMGYSIEGEEDSPRRHGGTENR